MAITYGGIALSLSTTELDALQDHYMRRDQVEEFDGLYGAPANLQYLPFSYIKPPELKQLGRLVWPRGAAKYAFAHFAVSDRILQLIRAQAYAGDTLNAMTLTLTDDSGREVSTDMSMLPARPISQIAAPGTPDGNLWMITLVDDRYYWWMRAYDISIVEGSTTWNNLYAQIASGLLIALTPDTVNANYGNPTRRFACYDQPLPVLLDQVAYSCGQRVIRNFDGTVVTQNYTTAKTVFDANWSGLTNRGFGGRMHTIGESGASGDMFALVPEAVRVVFPNEIIETGVISDVYEIDNTLAGLAPSQYPAIVTGFTGTQVFWGDQIAQTHASGGLPTNLATLAAYASQASKDWYLWQLGGVDAVYSGVDAWQPDGVTDTIEILYEEERLLTRVQRSPWNDRAGGGLQTNVAAASGSSGLGVFGQADDTPALPGYGPRETVDIREAHPTIGDNLLVTITDDPGNDRLQWDVDNLGLFGRVQASGSVVGPRRGLDISLYKIPSPVNGNNLGIIVQDDSGNDEIHYTLDNKGVWAQANGGGLVGPEPVVDIERVVPASLYTNLSVTAADSPINKAVQFKLDNLGLYGLVNLAGPTGPRRAIDFDDDTYFAGGALPLVGSYITWAKTDNAGADTTQFRAQVNPTDVVAAGGGQDWHYFRDITATHCNAWPVSFGSSGVEYQANTIFGAAIPNISGLIAYVPFLEGRGGVIDQVEIFVGTKAATAGSKVRLGIYNNRSATSLSPSSLLIDLGLVDVSVANNQFVGVSGLAQQLDPSTVYWLAIRYDSGAGGGAGAAKIPWISGLPAVAFSNYFPALPPLTWIPQGNHIRVSGSGPILVGITGWFVTGMGAMNTFSADNDPAFVTDVLDILVPFPRFFWTYSA